LVDRIAAAEEQDAIAEVRKCFDQIAAILAETAGKASRVNDPAMIDGLAAAKAAVDRGGELVARLAFALKERRSFDEAADTSPGKG
jgi:hypothetical protein